MEIRGTESNDLQNLNHDISSIITQKPMKVQKKKVVMLKNISPPIFPGGAATSIENGIDTQSQQVDKSPLRMSKEVRAAAQLLNKTGVFVQWSGMGFEGGPTDSIER